MRSDFDRAVIERARNGSSNRGLKMRKTGRLIMDSDDWNDWYYDGPLNIRTNGIRGVKHTYDGSIGDKSFTDVLRPVYGYLLKSVGRKWDDVYSELSMALGRGSWPTRHVLTQHALREVCVHTYEENGKIYSTDRDAYGKYFVDPRDGTLRKEADKPRYQYHKYTCEASSEYPRWYWKDGLWFVWIDGIWYLGIYTNDRSKANCLKYRGEPRRPEGYGNYLVYRSWESAHQSWFWPNIDSRQATNNYFVKWRQAGRKELKVLRSLISKLE